MAHRALCKIMLYKALKNPFDPPAQVTLYLQYIRLPFPTSDIIISILAEAARLRRASTAMRTVNDIPTSCVRCCIVAVFLKTEVRILSP